MTPDIIADLHMVAEPGRGNSFLLDRVTQRIRQRLYPDANTRHIEADIREHCTVTDSPSGPVLRGWALRKGA